METFFSDYLDILRSLHQEMAAILQSASAEALDWEPGPGMNSLAVLAAHVSGAERYWIGDVALGEPSGRVREAEFTTLGLSAAMLLERLEHSLSYAEGALGKLRLEDLGQTRISQRDGRSFTVSWCLAHTQEHTALHMGHMQITRQLLEVGTPGARE